MNHLVVTLFIHNKICHYRIDELIRNSFNGYINENFVFGNTNVYFPVQIQEDGYTIQAQTSSFQIMCNNEPLVEAKQLSHGDYLLFSKEKFSYSILIMERSFSLFGGTVYLLGNENVFIGRSEESNIVLDINAYVSRKCAAFRRDASGKYYIEDLSGKTGVYVNGIRETSKALSNGDEIYIMGVTMLYSEKMQAVKIQKITILKIPELYIKTNLL